MLFFQVIPASITLILLIRISTAIFSSTARTNVVLYYGQGSNQQSLLHFCQQSTVDVIALAFVDIFPAQGNGYPGTNFGNQCWGGNYVYHGPGDDPALNQLQSECPKLVVDIPLCQSTYGKKIILSLGGGTAGYQLAGTVNGEAFADFLWGAFGPRTAAWLSRGLPRPFDGANGEAVEVDGFDFDIEIPSTDNSAGYIAMIKRLRSHFTGATKEYLITGAPQCIVPDANMGRMIASAQFDIIWVQFYNTAQCSASNWAAANLHYTSTQIEEASGFSYNTWANFLKGTASANAKLYIGLSGSTAATTNPKFYITPTQVSNLAEAYFCKDSFGGIMIWEATTADNNVNSGSTYYESVKEILLRYAEDSKLSCDSRPATKPKSPVSASTGEDTRLSTSAKKSPTSVDHISSGTVRASSTITLRITSTTTKYTTRTSTITIPTTSPSNSHLKATSSPGKTSRHS